MVFASNILFMKVCFRLQNNFKNNCFVGGGGGNLFKNNLRYLWRVKYLFTP